MRVHGVCVNTVQACALRAASRARVGESVTLRPEGVRDCARTGSPILALHKAGAHKCAGCPARRGGEGCSHRACRIVSVLTLFYSTCRCYRRSLAHAHTSTLADTLLEAARSVCAREPQHGSLHKCAGVERSKSPLMDWTRAHGRRRRDRYAGADHGPRAARPPPRLRTRAPQHPPREYARKAACGVRQHAAAGRVVSRAKARTKAGRRRRQGEHLRRQRRATAAAVTPKIGEGRVGKERKKVDEHARRPQPKHVGVAARNARRQIGVRDHAAGKVSKHSSGVHGQRRRAGQHPNECEMAMKREGTETERERQLPQKAGIRSGDESARCVCEHGASMCAESREPRESWRVRYAPPRRCPGLR